MQDDATFQYVKLLLENLSLWPLLVVGVIVWIVRNPGRLAFLSTYVESARIGAFEVTLRKLEEKLEETEAHVSELEEENLALAALVTDFNVNAADRQEMEKARQTLKALAGGLNTTAPIIEGFQPGAPHEKLYAAAELQRARKDFALFDDLVACADRIASSDTLEGLRYKIVWTIASAIHRTAIAAVKHTDRPLLSESQLQGAKSALEKLRGNAHARRDSPANPKQGILGPTGHALDWIDKGLKKHHAAV